MSRRHSAVKREISPDPKFNNVKVAKFINKLMYEGKKTVSEKLVYQAFDLIQEKYKMDGLEAFTSALENVRPQLQLRSMRIGGSNHQIPEVCDLHRSENLAFKWIINAMRGRSERSSVEKLAAELVDAVNKRGAAIKKREDNHKMAESNKAFAHYSPKKTKVAS
jgi:small subunit ribosomal protein S7